MSCALAAMVAGASLAAFRTKAQEIANQPQDEIVANLAAGRVVIAVVKDAILIGTVENAIEAETRPPTPVELSGNRAAIMLGPVEWVAPASRVELAQFNRELPHLRSQAPASRAPRLAQGAEGNEASDIESIGQGLLERLSEVARGLHNRITLPSNEPLAELVIADYLPAYGPEVWQMSYGLEQLQQHGDYWDTRVERPKYLQFWPPEKGQPHTLVEFHYPPEQPSRSLLELLRMKDPRLEKLCVADQKMKEVADRFVAGESGKLGAAETTAFLRAALNVIAPDARQTMATVGRESGFAWVLKPPAEPKGPTLQREPQRPEGAPSLLHPPASE
jgi:hypothetical protein